MLSLPPVLEVGNEAQSALLSSCSLGETGSNEAQSGCRSMVRIVHNEARTIGCLWENQPKPLRRVLLSAPIRLIKVCYSARFCSFWCVPLLLV